MGGEGVGVRRVEEREGYGEDLGDDRKRSGMEGRGGRGLRRARIEEEWR